MCVCVYACIYHVLCVYIYIQREVERCRYTEAGMRRVRLIRNRFAGGDEDGWQETAATCPLKRSDGGNSQAPPFEEEAEEDPN